MWKLLDREVSRASLQTALAVAEPLLVQAVDLGVQTFETCMRIPNPRDHHLAILFPYRHLLDMLDAVQVLVAGASLGPARLQLRTAFETVLTMKHVTASDTEHRAYAYLVGERLTTIAYLERLLKSQNARPKQWIPPLIEQHKERLRLPGWREAYDEYRAAKVKKSNAPPRWWPHWYSLYGGPRNLAVLAERYGRLDDYDLLYRAWSDVAHVADLNWQMRPEGDAPVVRELRWPLHFNHVVSLVVEFIIDGTLCVAHFYGLSGKDDELHEWQAREYKPRMERLEEIPSLSLRTPPQ